MLDWLIVGGGVHGTHLSNVLMNRHGVPADKLVVLDPFDEPMERWKHCTTNVGMTHLRSPVVHHLGLEPMELLKFSRAPEGRKTAGFKPPYDRPSLPLFEAHCNHICQENDLGAVRRKGWAKHLHKCGSEGFEVETDRGQLQARRVVLAMGSGDRPRWPSWAKPLREGGGKVWHIFEDDFTVDCLQDVEHVVIVGLGISAAQLANRLAPGRDQKITVVGRHDIRVHQFDSEPCWLGPKCQVPFRKLKEYDERRDTIETARNHGSMPTDVAQKFQQSVNWGRIALKSEPIVSSGLDQGGAVELYLDNGECLCDVAVVLATGFESPRPDRGWLAEAIDEMGLSCARCGFPIVDKALQWTTGLHVSGPLAELELGPAARNIAGARMTARRLSSAGIAAR